MVYQRIHKSSSWNPSSQEKSSQFAPRPFAVQAQQDSHRSPTQEEIENEAFNQNKFEAFGLQRKEKHGTITPVEQERLGVLQAKMDDFWVQRRAKGSQFSYSLESILGRVPENPVSNNVQLKLAIQPHRSDVSPQSPKNRGIDFQRGDAQNHQIPPLQTKLTIGQPNDKYEQEADRVALQVVQQINSPVNTKSIQEQSVKRQTEEEEIQAKSEITSILRQGITTEEKASTELESAINSARGSGQPLAPNLQQSMGQAMKVDFSGVRVHTDAKSDQLNQSIQARAFTTGQDVFFRQGEYQPGSRSGQELIAHELTHVVQQGGNQIQAMAVQRTSTEVSENQGIENLIQRLKWSEVFTGEREEIAISDKQMPTGVEPVEGEGRTKERKVFAGQTKKGRSGFLWHNDSSLEIQYDIKEMRQYKIIDPKTVFYTAVREEALEPINKHGIDPNYGNANKPDGATQYNVRGFNYFGKDKKIPQLYGERYLAPEKWTIISFCLPEDTLIERDPEIPNGLRTTYHIMPSDIK